MNCVVCISGGGIIVMKEEPHNTFLFILERLDKRVSSRVDL